MAQFQVTQGTQTQLANDVVGTQVYPIAKIDVGNTGSTVPWQGSVTVSAGTVNAGTINTGTVNVGTIDSLSQLPPGVWGTSINASGTAFGTLHTAVGGSVIYITDLEINMAVVAGTVALYNGANTNLLAGSWAFNQNGGMVTNRRVPIQGLSGSALCYQQQGTASLSITANGFIK